jgi:hypothetical protein
MAVPPRTGPAEATGEPLGVPPPCGWAQAVATSAKAAITMAIRLMWNPLLAGPRHRPSTFCTEVLASRPTEFDREGVIAGVL